MPNILGWNRILARLLIKMEGLIRIKNYLILHKKVTLLFGLALLVFIFLNYYLIQPTLFLYSQSKSLALNTQPIMSAVKRGDIGSLNYELKYFRKTVVNINNAAAKIGIFSFLPVVGSYAADLSNVSQAGLETYDVASDLTAHMSPFIPRLSFSVWGSNEPNPQKVKPSDIAALLPAISKEIPKYKTQLASISQKILSIDERHYPPEFHGKPIRKYLNYMKTLASLTIKYYDDAAEALVLVPEAIGIGAPNNYLMIIQNDKELRPGGGLLGGYAIIAIQDGDFKLVKSGDISFLDNNVTAQRPAAPDFLSNYSGSNDLRLRDANYSSDFKESAQSIRKIWRSTPGSFDVGGILVVDTQFIKSLLENFGPVNLGENGLVSKDNIEETFGQYFLMTGDQSPQSRKYKDLVSIILNEILKKIFARSSYNIGDLLNQVGRQGQSKHFLVYFANDGLQKLAEKYNLAGRVVNYTGDYLHINEALLSNGRINWILNESVLKTVNLKDPLATSELTIELSGKPQFPESGNSTVNDLLRIYVPLGAKLLDTKGSSASVTQGEELGKTVFQASLRLESGIKTVLTIRYELPQTAVQGKEYKLLIQKQAGSADHKYKVAVNNKSEEFRLSQDREIVIKL